MLRKKESSENQGNQMEGIKIFKLKQIECVSQKR